MNSPKLKILLSLTILWGSRCAAPAEAAEQNRSFYHPEVKAILNGGKVMLFPSDHRLGTLQYPGAKGRRGKSISATGRVELPDKAEVMLVPSSYLLQNPALINCFGGAISGIELKSEEGTALLQKLAAKNSIKTLRLSGIAIDQKLISEINSLSQLTSLQFDHTEASSAAITTTPIKRLQQLEWLAVDASTTTLLKQIAKSNFLKKLEINNANLTLADFVMLQKLPALQFLSIQQSQYPDAAVAYFPRFRTLKILWLGQRHWTKQSILPLKKMTMLDELHVRMFDHELPLLVELHEALPEVVVN
jgi:hypothetical protein